VDDALRDYLLTYADMMPSSLITMGKMVLGAPGKVMHWRNATSRGAEAPPANWPIFVLLSYEAAQPAERRGTWRSAVPAAVAVEIAIAAADLIDEISDDDPSPIIQRYGGGQALNTANLMLVMSQQVLQWEAARGNTHALNALGALQAMLVEAAVGQHLDMAFEAMGPRDVTPEMSGEMTDKKAGALIAGACRMGALMAGAPGEVADLLARFGRQIGGIAQLTNDIQDVLPTGSVVLTPDGTPARVFAPKTDLRRRKRTLPIVFALRDDTATPNAVQTAFSGPPLDGEDEEAMRTAVVDAGGVAFSQLVLDVYRGNAAEVVAALEVVRPGAREVLSPILKG
jgi:geranylgeranyl pyrophosphate synthase